MVTTSMTKACIAPPICPLRFHFDPDSPHLFVSISRPLIERQLTQMLGRSLKTPLEFDVILDQFSPLSIRWLSVMQLLHEEIAHPTPLSRAEAGLATLEDFIAATLLMIQPSNYTQSILHPGRSPASRTLRRAVEYIECHLAEELNVSQIAEAVGCSTRTLQNAFASELNTTPLSYIKDQRLQRVHDELRDSAVASFNMHSISDIARSWGFTHMGRFAACYRSRFGENPSDTLAKAQ